MSWQAYVDQSLISTGNITAAAIHGHDGTKWASTNLEIPKEDAAKFVGYMNSPDPLYATGFKLGETKFRFIRAVEGEQIIGRSGADGGCIVCKTNMALIFGVFAGGIQPGNANQTVSKLADYLKSSNY
eukprot:m.331361 g.331361  ORF g.331361 m.331361 type:complete len:128 (+) comp16712_c0_seq1:88-471(+)